MTPKKRREWPRVFISGRQQGLGGLRLILISVGCARQVGSVVPFLVALRVVPRVAPTRGRVVRVAWHAPPTWAPRAVGASAVGIALWGVLMLSEGPAPRTEWEVEDTEVPEWILTGQGDAGVVAKKMPGKRMKGQEAPPGEAPRVPLTAAGWGRRGRRPRATCPSSRRSARPPAWTNRQTPPGEAPQIPLLGGDCAAPSPSGTSRF